MKVLLFTLIASRPTNNIIKKSFQMIYLFFKVATLLQILVQTTSLHGHKRASVRADTHDLSDSAWPNIRCQQLTHLSNRRLSEDNPSYARHLGGRNIDRKISKSKRVLINDCFESYKDLKIFWRHSGIYKGMKWSQKFKWSEKQDDRVSSDFGHTPNE